MTVTSSGYYAAGSLRMVKTTDEDGKAQWTFTDRSGKTVLVRQMEQKGTSQVLYDTYYMYDGAGNLLCVLPPELSAKAPITGILPKAELDKYAYLYSYDSFIVFRNVSFPVRTGKGSCMMMTTVWWLRRTVIFAKRGSGDS